MKLILDGNSKKDARKGGRRGENLGKSGMPCGQRYLGTWSQMERVARQERSRKRENWKPPAGRNSPTRQ